MSNLGRAYVYHGGVGCNGAETMALLGSAVRFCSAVQQGGIGNEVLQRLSAVTVDVQGVFVTPEPDGHGMWVAILQRDADLVVLELDLSVELAEAVLRNAARDKVPVVGLPVSSIPAAMHAALALLERGPAASGRNAGCLGVCGWRSGRGRDTYLRRVRDTRGWWVGSIACWLAG